jgi:hypothetical protein
MSVDRFFWDAGDVTIEHQPVSKAAGDLEEINRLLAQDDRISAQVRQAYLDAVARLQSQVDVDRITELLRAGRYTEAINAINAQNVAAGYAPVVDAITAATFGVARGAAALATQSGGIQFSFSQVNPQAVGFVRQYEMNLIREMTSDTLATVRGVISSGVAAGDHPFDIAREVRQYIGLTERQAQAVRNYRRLLEGADAQALDRALRDRRFDSSVRRHVSGDRNLSPDQISTMVERYRQRYLRHRSETIARTEAKRALGTGNQLLWNQAVAAGRVAEQDVTKTWVTVGDHKVRPFHRELNKQVVGLNVPFTCSGGEIMYPGDPAADVGMTANCRCTCIYRFKVRGK